MLPIHTILFPTDFSENAQQAFPQACSLARDCGARLVVLYVVPPPMGHDQLVARRNPSEYHQGPWQALHKVQAHDHNIRVEHRLSDGHAATEILKVADEIQAGLIVIGTHGRTGLGRLLLGSVAEQVLREASCPVLTVKQSSVTPKPKTIIFPMDFSESSEAALGVAFALARDYHARLIILHVVSPGPMVSYGEFEKLLEQSSGYRRELEEKLRQCQKPECKEEFRLEEGDPANVILRVAQEVPCDLIVMGTHGRTGLRHLLLGSVAEKILRNAPCPVLMLKNPIAGVETSPAVAASSSTRLCATSVGGIRTFP